MQGLCHALSFCRAFEVSRPYQCGSALHIRLIKQFHVPVDQKRLLMRWGSTQSEVLSDKYVERYARESDEYKRYYRVFCPVAPSFSWPRLQCLSQASEAVFSNDCNRLGGPICKTRNLFIRTCVSPRKEEPHVHRPVHTS